MAVAIPVIFPDGADPMPTVGVLVYPPPLLVTVINFIPPLTIPVTAVAVTPIPTNVSVCVDPNKIVPPSNPSIGSSKSSILSTQVLINSSSYLKSSHFNS